VVSTPLPSRASGAFRFTPFVVRRPGFLHGLNARYFLLELRVTLEGECVPESVGIVIAPLCGNLFRSSHQRFNPLRPGVAEPPLERVGFIRSQHRNEHTE
jgi:hypothetical protein